MSTDYRGDHRRQIGGRRRFRQENDADDYARGIAGDDEAAAFGLNRWVRSTDIAIA
jgi:hypothetical protein